jgi:hypothetical protein
MGHSPNQPTRRIAKFEHCLLNFLSLIRKRFDSANHRFVFFVVRPHIPQLWEENAPQNIWRKLIVFTIRDKQ